MPKLILKELPKPVDERIADEMLRSNNRRFDWEKTVIDEAGQHRIIYSHLFEVRYGDAYYSAVVEGANGSRITKLLKGQKVYRRRQAYLSGMNWYAFEVLNDTMGGICSIWVFDLSSGDLIFTFNSDSLLPISFTSWIANTCAFIFTHHGKYPNWSWHKYNISTGEKELLFAGGTGTTYITGDGKFFIMCDSSSCSISLVSTESGELLDKLNREDFGSWLDASKSFHVYSFDADKAHLTAFLNLHEHSRDAVRFDRTVSIEIAA
jgi:hypothetical protein